MASAVLCLVCLAFAASALDVRPHQNAKPHHQVEQHAKQHRRDGKRGRALKRQALLEEAAAPPAPDECTLLDDATAPSFFSGPSTEREQLPADPAVQKASGSSGYCPPTNLLMPLRYREDLGAELARKNFTGVGVEVGTEKGSYTRTLLGGWKLPRLFVQVDLWKHQENYRDIANLNDTTQESIRKHACMNAKYSEDHKFADRVIQCRNFSAACAEYFPDGSLDFVYLDARHDRKGLLEDLHTYWPKVRPGGVLAGHDYVIQDEPTRNSPRSLGQDWTINYDGTRDESGRVAKGAVDDFFFGTSETPEDLKRCPRQLVISYHDYGFFTWMVGK